MCGKVKKTNIVDSMILQNSGWKRRVSFLFLSPITKYNFNKHKKYINWKKNSFIMNGLDLSFPSTRQPAAAQPQCLSYRYTGKLPTDTGNLSTIEYFLNSFVYILKCTLYVSCRLFFCFGLVAI